jgi:hypothetical protein
MEYSVYGLRYKSKSFRYSSGSRRLGEAAGSQRFPSNNFGKNSVDKTENVF